MGGWLEPENHREAIDFQPSMPIISSIEAEQRIMMPRASLHPPEAGVPNPLPCRHQQEVIRQIQPTVELLRRMDVEYPDILRQHLINPDDYHSGLVFRSAVESIRGSYIASSTPGRERLVAKILSSMKDRGLIKDYEQKSSRQRWDFEVYPEIEPLYLAVIEVKGGEGNSINISERSRWVSEFAIWSHLDGSIQHEPSHGAKLVINRITNELSTRRKQVDMLFFRDMLCGTRARPCPKYPGQETTISARTCPDIYLFPQEVPTIDDPDPPVHTLDTLRLPKLLLDHFEVPPNEYSRHLWYVHLRVVRRENDSSNRLQRLISIRHQGVEVATGRGRPFTPTEQ